MTQQYTNLFDMVIATANHLGSSCRPGHCRRQRSKSPKTHLGKLASTVSKTCSKSTRDASYPFLVHTGRGLTHLSCFWSTLPVLDLAISVMVACLEICRYNKIRRNYSWGILAPHVEIYYLAMIFHDFLSKRLEFCTTHKISQYIDDVHP
jgi:hypothetical protein